MHHNPNDLFPGFPQGPVTNYWPYPKALNGWWHALNGSEQKCLDFILRHTWGFKKVADRISLTQFQHGVRNLDKGTGLSQPAIINALVGLERKGFIRRVKTKGRTNYYELQKNPNDTTKDNLVVTTKNSLDTITNKTIEDINNVPVSQDSKKKTYKTEIETVVSYLSSKLSGFKFPNYGKQARYAKLMFEAGYTTDDIFWAINKLLENTWWRENSFDLKNVCDEIPKLMTRTFKSGGAE